MISENSRHYLALLDQLRDNPSDGVLSALDRTWAIMTTEEMAAVDMNSTLCLDVWELTLPEACVHLACADPPYGRIVGADWDKAWTADDYMRLAQKLETWLCDGGSALVWGGVGRPKDRVFFEFLALVEHETSLTIKNVITWSKKRAYGKADDYLFTREEVVWLLKGDKPRTFNVPLLEEKRGYAGYNPDYPAKSEFKRRTNVWTDITEVMRDKAHECEKPKRLAEVQILTHSNSGDIVLDLFSGSGNISLECQRLGRRSIAVDKNPDDINRLHKLLMEGFKKDDQQT